MTVNPTGVRGSAKHMSLYHTARIAGVLFAPALLGGFLGFQIPVAGAAVVAQTEGQVTMANWSGYAVEKAGTTFSDVKGTWVVPSLDCNSTDVQQSSDLIGIDGFSAGGGQATTMEEIGIQADCDAENDPHYWAWYEDYPNPVTSAQTIPLALKAGNVISAEVHFLGGQTFNFSLVDETTGATFSKSIAVAGAKRSSAEWIVSNPGYAAGQSLPNFATVNFTGSYATGNGQTGSIDDSAWNYFAITMKGSATAPAEATPSSLSQGGKAFYVSWDSPCPRCT